MTKTTSKDLWNICWCLQIETNLGDIACEFGSLNEENIEYSIVNSINCSSDVPMPIIFFSAFTNIGIWLKIILILFD